MNTLPPSFDFDLTAFVTSRMSLSYTVLCGLNNSGKSYALKNIKNMMNTNSYMIGANRFYHLVHIASQMRDPQQYTSWDNQFRSQINNPDFNYEQNFIDLGRILANLNDQQRQLLFDLCGELIGCKFQLKRFEPDNQLSMAYVDMDGQNLALGSTGTRLLMTMLGLCFDDKFEHILIDEPELGLSPKIQNVFSEFLRDKNSRAKYFPHLKSVWVATHSHLFLDRASIGNNFIVAKNTDNVISFEQTNSFTRFHNLQFNLLGNTLESLFLPSAFVLVEGKTDQNYLERWLQLKLPDRKILFSQTNGDPKAKVYALRESLGDIFKSPFRSRIFVVLDSVHTPSDVAAMEKMGILRENIIIWDKNGIEYLYPPDVVSKVFCCSLDEINDVVHADDAFSLNGITKKKIEFSNDVLAHLDVVGIPPSELQTKFLDAISRAIN